jgi:hypothetical protein
MAGIRQRDLVRGLMARLNPIQESAIAKSPEKSRCWPAWLLALLAGCRFGGNAVSCRNRRNSGRMVLAAERLPETEKRHPFPQSLYLRLTQSPCELRIESFFWLEKPSGYRMCRCWCGQDDLHTIPARYKHRASAE